MLLMQKLSASQSFPKFSNGDISPWLRKFNEYCSRFSVPDDDKINEVVSFLNGAASEWHYSCCNATNFASWETLAKERFGISDDEIFDQLDSLHISQFDKPENFLDRFSNLLLQYQNSICGVYNAGKPNAQVRAFRRGQALSLLRHTLTNDYRNLLCSNPPEDVDEAIALIRRHARYSMKDALTNNATKSRQAPHQKKLITPPSTSEPLSTDQNLEQLVSEMRKLTMYLIKGDAPRNQSQKCYNCNQLTDHSSRNCKEPCSICKDPSHPSAFCPDRIRKPRHQDTYLVESYAAERTSKFDNKVLDKPYSLERTSLPIRKFRNNVPMLPSHSNNIYVQVPQHNEPFI